MTKIEIILKDGKWLINGVQYHELTWQERIFFDEFLMTVKSESTVIKEAQVLSLNRVVGAIQNYQFKTRLD